MEIFHGIIDLVMGSVENITSKGVSRFVSVHGIEGLIKLFTQNKVLFAGYLVLISVLPILTVIWVIKKYKESKRKGGHQDNEVEHQSMETEDLNKRIKDLNKKIKDITRDDNRLIGLTYKKNILTKFSSLVLDPLETDYINLEYSKRTMNIRVVEKELELFLLKEEIEINELNSQIKQRTPSDIIEALEKQLEIRDRLFSEVEDIISFVDESIRSLLLCDSRFRIDDISALDEINYKIKGCPVDCSRDYGSTFDEEIDELINKIERHSNEVSNQAGYGYNPSKRVEITREEKKKLKRDIACLNEDIEGKKSKLAELNTKISSLKKS